MKHTTYLSAIILAAGIVTTSLDGFACAACGCSLSTEAVTGYSSAGGWSLSLQYDYINQNQLRSGRNSVSPSRAASINDAGGSQEVEKGTLNRYITLGLGYSPNADWNLKLLVPYVDRSHSTYGQALNPLTPDQVSGANVSSLGDIKFLVSYQGLLSGHNLGVELGVKLPTGDYGGANAGGTGTVGRNPARFTTGPNAGELLDTSLQAGTGSTDLIVGVYYHKPLSPDFDAFANLQFQTAVIQALNRPGEDFRPGNQEVVSFGVRYEANPGIVPQLQVNINHRSKDLGALADTPNSAGTAAYLSPGVSFGVMKNVQLYGFGQLPIYSKLEGYQLFPHWTASVGLSCAF